MIVMLILSLLCILGNAYFLVWQTYIMWIELVIHLAAVGFTVSEIVLAGISLIVFSQLNSEYTSKTKIK
jgi:hypothetical protein